MIAAANPRVASSGVGRQLGDLTQPWWPLLGVVAVLVILAAVLQLAPPLIVRSIVDDHLAVGTSQGLLLLALLYLAAMAGTQAFIFGYHSAHLQVEQSRGGQADHDPERGEADCDHQRESHEQLPAQARPPLTRAALARIVRVSGT